MYAVPMELTLDVRSSLRDDDLAAAVRDSIELVPGVVQCGPVDVASLRTMGAIRIVTVRVEVFDSIAVPSDPDAHPEDACLTGDVLAAVLASLRPVRGVSVVASGAEWVIS